MKFERGTSNTFVLPARPTLTPSNWLLRFVRVENGVEMLCIADAYTQPGKPVQVTFTEVNSSPDPLDGEITLQAGQWEVHVYEQTSATNLNYTQAPREPFATLVLVEGAAIAPPPPTDPCSGDCPATTVNGTESDVPDITVLQGGIEVGTLNPATGVHTVPECEPVTIRTTDGSAIIATPEAGTNYDLPSTALGYEESNGESAIYVTLFDTVTEETEIKPDVVIPRRQIFNDNDEPLGLYVTLANLLNDTVPQVPACDCPECAPATLSVNDTPVDTAADPCGHAFNLPVKNEDATPVGSLVAGEWIVPTAKSLCALVTEGTAEEVSTCIISSGKRADVLAELIPTVDEADVLTDIIGPLTPGQDAVVAVTVQLRDSAANNIGSADTYAPGTSTNKTAPDGTVVVKNLNGTTLGSPTVRSNASANYTAPIPLKFAMAAGDDTSITWTVTDDEAGTYGTYTQDGSSGTLTYSLNGGAFAALSGAIVLAVGNTIAVRRTTFTTAGFIKWAP